MELSPSLSVSLKIQIPSTSSNVQLAGVSADAGVVTNPTRNAIPNHRNDFDMVEGGKAFLLDSV